MTLTRRETFVLEAMKVLLPITFQTTKLSEAEAALKNLPKLAVSTADAVLVELDKRS